MGFKVAAGVQARANALVWWPSAAVPTHDFCATMLHFMAVVAAAQHATASRTARWRARLNCVCHAPGTAAAIMMNNVGACIRQAFDVALGKQRPCCGTAAVQQLFELEQFFVAALSHCILCFQSLQGLCVTL